MFCIKCGAQNEEGAKFCTNCGASLTDVVWSAPQAAPMSSSEPEPEPELEEESEPEPDPELEVQSEPGPEPASEPEPTPDSLESDTPLPEEVLSPVEESPVEVPPQEWPDYSEQGPFQEGGAAKKSLGTGAIVGVIIGGLAVVALIIVGVLFATGAVSSDAPASPAGEVSTDDGDAQIDGFGQGLSELFGGGSGNDAHVSTDLDGTIFDLTRYEGTPADVEGFLEDNGLELVGSWSSEGGEYIEPYMSATFAGDYDGPAPISIDGSYLEVSVQVELGSTEIAWDEDGYADDAVSSLSELAGDATVSGVQIDFYSDVEPSGFASAAHGVFSSMGLPRVSGVSASDDEILDSALSEFGLSESEGSVSDYIGEVLFVDGDLIEFAGREAYCQVSLMGGEEFSNRTMAGISVFS